MVVGLELYVTFTMKPKTINVLEMCIDTGVSLGYNRAHKHDDNPSEEVIKDKIREAIMNEIYEWFDFEDLKDE